MQRHDKLAHIPYTTLAFTALGTAIARKIHAIKNACYKVIVVDADQTLWEVFVEKTGLWELKFDAEHRAIQEFLIENTMPACCLVYAAGITTKTSAKCSHVRKEMPLKREHFAVWRVNGKRSRRTSNRWLEELKIGLDSIVFIDDDDVGCAEVQAQCPQVLTLQLPSPDMIRVSAPSWPLDRLRITNEADARTAFYRQQATREQFREKSLSLKDFLASLDLQIEIAPMADQQVARGAELTLRTNQFNLTTIRRSEAEIRALCERREAECLVVRVKDRVGDYGLVGLMIFKLASDTLSVDAFLLSCRALGRGVEHRMLAALGEAAKQRGSRCVEVAYVPTRKNRPARDFLDSLCGRF